MSQKSVLLVLAVVMTTFALAPARAADNTAKPAVDAAYRQDFDKWQTELTDDLKQNWLTLAGLFWLKPGENTFGTDPKNAIVMPVGTTPAQAGVFILNGKDVSLKLASGAQAKIDGKQLTQASLQPDSSGKPTRIEMGSLRMHVIVRGDRVGLRVKDLNRAEARNFHGMDFFPIDLSYRVTATWVPSDGKKTIDVPNVLGDVSHEPISGQAKFTLNGHEVYLTDLGGDPTKGLFFVFTDATAKTDTYPGGRFLETDPVANGEVVLDFNRAHNPPCAVTPYATCPLAPKENRLAVAIPAGEKYDHKAGHH
jgi:uncharacterized protein